MQADAAERGVRDGAAAKGKVERGEVWTAERDDFGSGIGEGAAERLWVRCTLSAYGRAKIEKKQ